jgi:hypothetical protein
MSRVTRGGVMTMLLVLMLVVGASGCASTDSTYGGGASSSDSYSTDGTDPGGDAAPVPLKPDPATETPDSTYCTEVEGGTSCRDATADDPDGCMRATEKATETYDPNNPDAGIPADCLAKGY